MAVYFYFVRHGQTEYNRKGIVQGHQEIPLNERGMEQARQAGVALKERLSSERGPSHFDRMILSPVLRAKMTGLMIHSILTDSGTRIPLSFDWSFAEVYFGKELCNVSIRECGEEIRRVRKEWKSGNGSCSFSGTGGESLNGVIYGRVLPALRGIVEEERAQQIGTQDRHVLVVTHGALIECLLVHFTRLSGQVHSGVQMSQIKNCSLTTLKFDPLESEEWSVVSFPTPLASHPRGESTIISKL